MELTPGVVHSLSLDRQIMACIYRCRIPQNSLPLTSSVFGLLVLPSPPAPGNHRSFYWLHRFASCRLFYCQNHVICSVFRLLLLRSHVHLGFLQVFSWFGSTLLFSTEKYSVVWMYHNLFIHLSKDILAASGFWQ